jgi:hypothetical protein
MSGVASLGLRSSGSYGSLQQSNGQSPAPAPSPPLAARKAGKMSFGGAGAGGRGLLFARICKLTSRRRRMLLLLLVAAAVLFCFLFSSLVSKGTAYLTPCFLISLCDYQTKYFVMHSNDVMQLASSYMYKHLAFMNFSYFTWLL